MSVSIQIEGIPKVRKFLSAKNKETLMRASVAVKNAGFFIQDEVVQSIGGYRAEPKSVDTGFFKNSILSVSKQLTANVGSNKYPVDYAKILEYGDSKGRRPRRHFKNTAVRNTKKVKNFIEKEIRKI